MQKTHLVGEGVRPAPLANPHHIFLSHQQPQCLADVWVVPKVSSASPTPNCSTGWSISQPDMVPLMVDPTTNRIFCLHPALYFTLLAVK